MIVGGSVPTEEKEVISCSTEDDRLVVIDAGVSAGISSILEEAEIFCDEFFHQFPPFSAGIRATLHKTEHFDGKLVCSFSLLKKKGD